MSVFKRIGKSDVVTVPYTANKQWDFSHLDMVSSSIYVYTGVKMTGSFNPVTDPMTTNSQYKRLVYESINHQFYQAYSGSTVNNRGLLQSNYYESASTSPATASYINPQILGYTTASFPEAVGSTIKVLSIPTSVYGNSINPGTFTLSSSAYYITDDGYGNLRSGSVLVGNIFYPYGVAVITNQDYQSYFLDESTTPIRWSNFNTPYNTYVDSNLRITVNSIEKVFEDISSNGAFTSNVGDTVLIEAFADNPWPTTGTSSLSLEITGRTTQVVSGSLAYASSSFTIASQDLIQVSAYTTYIPPITINWVMSEYEVDSVAFLDANFRILGASNGVTYFDQLFSGTGSVTIDAGVPLQLYSYCFTNEGDVSIWGPYVSASLSNSITEGTSTIASGSTYINKNGGTMDLFATPAVTLQPGGNYTFYTSTSNPT